MTSATPTAEQRQESMDALRRMIDLLGLPAEITENAEDENFALALKSDEPGRLIGRKGHHLHSLELLLNRILRKSHRRFPWVEVDVDGYQRKRKRKRRSGDSGDSGDSADSADSADSGDSGDSGGESGSRRSDGESERHREESARARQMALDAAKEVKRWGQRKRLGPFNSAERQAVHDALADDAAVVSESEAVERNGRKRVIIRLAGQDAD